MLHMIVNTHEADSCGFRDPENLMSLTHAVEAVEESAKAANATVEGVWVNLASHHIFILLDAPNAHVVDDIIRNTGLIGPTNPDVCAVTALEEALRSVG